MLVTASDHSKDTGRTNDNSKFMPTSKATHGLGRQPPMVLGGVRGSRRPTSLQRLGIFLEARGAAISALATGPKAYLSDFLVQA